MMVHFRKRMGPKLIKVCNGMTKANGIAMIQEQVAICPSDRNEAKEMVLETIETELGVRPATPEPGSNSGTLIIDATCEPDYISYPADLRLLNECRETTETIIDELFKHFKSKINRKPRCNRDKARNLFLAMIKKKRPNSAETRETKRFQLNEIRRNPRAIDGMIHSGAVRLEPGVQLYRQLLVTSEVQRQRQEMYGVDNHRINNRKVNPSKLYGRIDRGKAGKKTEFGAKISSSDDDRFVDVDQISGGDSFNEGNDLID